MVLGLSIYEKWKNWKIIDCQRACIYENRKKVDFIDPRGFFYL